MCFLPNKQVCSELILVHCDASHHDGPPRGGASKPATASPIVMRTQECRGAVPDASTSCVLLQLPVLKAAKLTEFTGAAAAQGNVEQVRSASSDLYNFPSPHTH